MPLAPPTRGGREAAQGAGRSAPGDGLAPGDGAAETPGPIRMATEVPRIREQVMASGRRSGPKTIRAGSLSRAHDEKRVRSKRPLDFPV